MSDMRLTTAFIFSLLIFFSCREETQEIGKANPDDENNGGTTETPVSGKYEDCLFIPVANSLDIVTWNIEHFPKETSTVALLTEIIKSMNADVIAVQEIESQDAFNQLVSALEGWSGKLYFNGSLGQGFLYKNSEITSSTDLTLLFAGDTGPFPRPLVVTTVTHTSGKVVTLINVHLKCCDEGETRRQEASVKLKSYIDNNLSDKAVVVLGDYNDDITSPTSTNVFQNFINDGDHYRFTDMPIAAGSSLNWSYPSWPSHLDHLLVTNELFSSIDKVTTLELDKCESRYEADVSDHRPVMLQLK
jgi:endonuclease/exonuclease/phosphatase family metal-dependent hydrolase